MASKYEKDAFHRVLLVFGSPLKDVADHVLARVGRGFAALCKTRILPASVLILLLAAGCNRSSSPPAPISTEELPAVLEKAFVKAEAEILVALGVLAANGLLVLVRDNRRAFFLALLISLAGLGLIAVALWGRSAGRFGAFPFMVLVGFGLYLPYIAVHTTIFERLIAITRDRGNMGYLMYLADAFGYLGYVAVMVGKDVYGVKGDVLALFTATCWVVALVSMAALAVALIFFAGRSKSGRFAAQPIQAIGLSG